MPDRRSLLTRFMASSDFSANQAGRVSLDYVRELLYRVFSIIVPLGVGASMLFSWFKLGRVLAVAEGVLLVLLLANAVLVFTANRRLFSNLAFCLVLIFFLVAPVSMGFVEFIYFCIIYTIAFYILVERRQALPLNAVWLVVCSLAAWYYMPPVHALSYAVSHLFAWVFTEVFFSLLAYNEKELQLLSVRDPLTGAHNRRAMETFLEDASLLCDRYGEQASIVMLDIDYFKEINDEYGHKEGDQVLKQLVALVDKRLRHTDRLCRYGGEEFVLALPNTGRDQAVELAESVREQVKNAIITSKRRITISCGVAQAQAGESMLDWLHRADLALYKAKQNGRDRVELDGDVVSAGHHCSDCTG